MRRHKHIFDMLESQLWSQSASSKLLLNLVNGMIDMNNIQHDNFEQRTQPVVVSSILSELYHIFGRQGLHRGIELDFKGNTDALNHKLHFDKR